MSAVLCAFVAQRPHRVLARMHTAANGARRRGVIDDAGLAVAHRLAAAFDQLDRVRLPRWHPEVLAAQCARAGAPELPPAAAAAFLFLDAQFAALGGLHTRPARVLFESIGMRRPFARIATRLGVPQREVARLFAVAINTLAAAERAPEPARRPVVSEAGAVGVRLPPAHDAHQRASSGRTAGVRDAVA